MDDLLKKLMKTCVSVFLAAAFIMGGSMMSFATADDQILYTVTLNGKNIVFDQDPVNVGGRILVPMRGIFEACGADVTWDSDKNQVTAVKGNITVKLTIDSTTAYVNNVAKTLDAPATLINSRTMVPVRFVSEALKADVKWIEETATVSVTLSENSSDALVDSSNTVFTDIADITNSAGFFSTQQGIKGSCYLTCLGMISSNLNGEEIYASHVYKLNSNSVNQHDFFGLLQKLNITRTDYFNLKGLSSREKITKITDLLSESSEGVIIRFLNGNQSHYVVVKGFKDGKLIVNDPVGQTYVPLDKCWTGYSMFTNYDDSVEGIVLVESYNKGNSIFSWDFLDKDVETPDDDEPTNPDIIEE